MRTIALCALLMLPAQFAFSAIHSCRLADGTVVFQDTACAVIPKAAEKPKNRPASIPFGIEKSWFDRPPVVPDRAICTKAGCHCALFSRKFKTGLHWAIADALYLDGSWHRLASTLLQLELDQGTLSAIDRSDLQKGRDEAACNILMSQETLRLFGPDTLRELRNKKRYAEDRGLDDPADCEAGNELVCAHTDLISLYERMRSDIKALSGQARSGADDETVATTDEE